MLADRAAACAPLRGVGCSERLCDTQRSGASPEKSHFKPCNGAQAGVHVINLASIVEDQDSFDTVSRLVRPFTATQLDPVLARRSPRLWDCSYIEKRELLSSCSWAYSVDGFSHRISSSMSGTMMLLPYSLLRVPRKCFMVSIRHFSASSRLCTTMGGTREPVHLAYCSFAS